MYKVIFDDKAIEFLEKLDTRNRERIFNKILSTKENPFHYFEKLTARNLYKLRVGTYRVIANIDENNIKILVLLIGHRKNIYKKL
ncbi:MAG: type II toxin-antitoxin system RelE/ParE family toxin [Thermoplasmatales archaeon]|nr:type II toxin-antitoxin system RelE/ParE family toxin [Thermoplasmatales archaeon]